MNRLNVFICLAFWISISSPAAYSQSDWDLIFLRFEYNTSDTNIANFDLRTKRSRSGIYAINGSFVIGIDIDDTFSAALKVYQNHAGSSQYRETPFAVQKTSFYNFMTTIYVKLLQNELSQCTNLPVSEEKFDKPLPIGTYVMDMCVLSNEKMPGHMQPGLYKITVHFTRNNFDLWMAMYFDIQAKTLL